MSERSHACPKCSGEMIEGSAAGRGGRPGLRLSIRIDELLDRRRRGGHPDELERYFVTSYRRAGCGYVEQYARQRHYDAS